MAMEYGQQRGIEAEDLLSSPIRVRRRSALQELGDYPFFDDSDTDIDAEEARPAAPQASSWMVRRGGVCLAVLAVTSVVEVIVLGMLMR